MKYWIVLILFLACESLVPTDTKGEEPPIGPEPPKAEKLTLQNPIEDMSFEEGIDTVSIDLSAVFFYGLTPDSSISLFVKENSNTNVITTSVLEQRLLFTFSKDSFGVVTFTVLAQKANQEAEDSFRITYSEIKEIDYLEESIALFQSENYEGAAEKAVFLIQSKRKGYNAPGYLIKGYSEMYFGKFSEAYKTLKEGIKITEASYRNSFKAGIAYLEYGYKSNYRESIRLGLEVILDQPTYQFEYDSNINHDDVLLTVCLGQFGLQHFVGCYENIRILDPFFQLSESDPLFIQKLDYKLQELIQTIR